MEHYNHPLAYKKEVEPFFNIVMEGLQGLVDGPHFWDTIAENAVFEFLFNFPGLPNKIEGREDYMKWFESYIWKLDSSDNLVVHRTTDPKVVILEYSVHGSASHTGKKYDNNFCSVITIENRKVIRWRDYMDSLAVMSSVSEA